MINNAYGFEIYLNCANPAQAKAIMDKYPLDGITSNPQMIATQNDERTDFANIVLELREAAGSKMLFLQTPSNNYDDIMKDAMALRELGGANTCVKIPACPDGIKAIETLTSMGIPCLGTQVMSTMQGILALKAGARYIAPFFAPMEFSNINGKAVFDALVSYKNISKCEGQIMGCAPRNMEDVSWLLTTGVTACTLDPCDFEDPFIAEAFVALNKDVQNSWNSRFGNKRIYEMV